MFSFDGRLVHIMLDIDNQLETMMPTALMGSVVG
ncbi:unnamed protein product, partial [marine sediment metagenome]